MYTFQFFLQILYWLRIFTLNMISWLRQIFIWTDIRKRISFTVWYLEILKSILVIAIWMLETFFKMMWHQWFTVPVKFSSYHWNLICTEYSGWDSGKVLNFTNTVKHVKDFQYIRLILKDFFNSWFHYRFVFKLSLRTQWMQLHFFSESKGSGSLRAENSRNKQVACQIQYLHFGHTKFWSPISEHPGPHAGIYLTFAIVFTEQSILKDFSMESGWFSRMDLRAHLWTV